MNKSKLFQPLVSLKGLAMGMAEVVPGVSGGTIAFVTGIYEQLIESIKSINGTFFQYLFQLQLGKAWNHVNGNFLFSLLIGMVLGLVLATFSITYLLEHYPPVIWGFFFGLIVASIPIIWQEVKSPAALDYVFLFMGVAIASLIVMMIPVEGSLSYPYVFLSGMLAFCALILPGISGSFILLLLGVYQLIIPMLKSFLQEFKMDQLFLLMVFGFGGLLGLAMFSRLLSYLFKHYKNRTLAMMAGFMLGSLWKIWPWRNPSLWLDGTITRSELPDGQSWNWEYLEHIKLLKEALVFPQDYILGPPFVGAAIGAFVLGLLIMYCFSKMDQKSGVDSA